MLISFGDLVTGPFVFFQDLTIFGDTNLTSVLIWKACFELASLVGSILSFNILPHVGLIQSIILLLSPDEEGLPVYRCVPQHVNTLP